MTLVVDDDRDNRGRLHVLSITGTKVYPEPRNTGYGRGPATMIKAYLQLQGPSIDH